MLVHVSVTCGPQCIKLLRSLVKVEVMATQMALYDFLDSVDGVGTHDRVFIEGVVEVHCCPDALVCGVHYHAWQVFLQHEIKETFELVGLAIDMMDRKKIGSAKQFSFVQRAINASNGKMATTVGNSGSTGNGATNSGDLEPWGGRTGPANLSRPAPSEN